MYGQTTNGTFARKMRHICNETKKKIILLKEISERVVKTGFYGVLPFFSCIVTRSPSY